MEILKIARSEWKVLISIGVTEYPDLMVVFLCILTWILKVTKHLYPEHSHCEFGGCWRFLTGVWYPDLDLEMVLGF